MAKHIDFPQKTGWLGGGLGARFGTERDVTDLPVWKDGNYILSCWRLSWRERISALLFGNAWLWVVARHTHPPIAINLVKTPFKVKK